MLATLQLHQNMWFTLIFSRDIILRVLKLPTKDRPVFEAIEGSPNYNSKLKNNVIFG